MPRTEMWFARTGLRYISGPVTEIGMVIPVEWRNACERRHDIERSNFKKLTQTRTYEDKGHSTQGCLT